MSDRLDNYLSAYGDNFDYAFDNEIMLNWYPKRIMMLTSAENKVLELGVGHGYTCNHFSDFYAKYSVIDGSKSVIENFKKQYPESKTNMIQSYFENFVTNQVFDLIIMGFVLEHVDDPVQILNHFKSFMNPNGRCFVTVPNAESLHRRFGHEAGLLPDMLALGAGDQALGHKRSFTITSMTHLLEGCGYRIVRTEGIFLKPLATYQLKLLGLSKEILDGMCKVGVDYPELSAGLFFEATVAK